MMKIELSDGKKYIHLGMAERKSMRGNIYFDLVRGAIGTRLKFELYGAAEDYRPQKPEVWLTAQKRHEPTAIDYGWCAEITTTTTADDLTFSITGVFVFGAASANIPAGEYEIRFTTYEVQGARTVRHIFPTDAEQPSGILRIIEKL